MSKLFASCTVRVLPPRGRGDKRLVADGAAVHEVMVASHGPADYLRCVDWKQVGSNSCDRLESRNTPMGQWWLPLFFVDISVFS